MPTSSGHVPSVLRAHDVATIERVNRLTGAALVVRGRSLAGELGGAIFVEWPDGRPGAVTVFHGQIAEAQQAAAVVNRLQARGLPVPRHQLVVDLGDQVLFVQQQLPAGPLRELNSRRVEGIVGINERFRDAAVDMPDVPSVIRWFQPPGGDPGTIVELIPHGDRRTREVVEEILKLTASIPSDMLTRHDVVHVDLTAANVLFDENDCATAVIDWNLGVYRGDRRLALVQTRFDREWFVRRPDADGTVIASARRLDEMLGDQIPPGLLRVYWAFWLQHHLPKAFRAGVASVIAWHVELAESRLK